MQNNFYYGSFGKYNRYSHSNLPSYSEHLNHCNNFTAFTGAQAATDTVDDTACVPSVYIRYIYLSHQSQQHISGSHIVSAGCIDPIQVSVCHNDQRKLIRIYVHSSSQCIDDL